jgi:hypothetical protein
MTITLTMRHKMELRDKMDGTGYEFVVGYNDHKGHLQIGNVSVAFDDRNNFRCGDDEYSGAVAQVEENRDDPVRLNGQSVPKLRDPAEMLMRALAADLGFTVTKAGCEGCEPENSFKISV